MLTIVTALSLFGSAIWIVILVLPWRPWSTREAFDPDGSMKTEADLSEVTVLIPARNEENEIAQTLAGLNHQGRNLKIILIDDQSEDRTAEIARAASQQNLKIISGKQLPSGWAGKLWALEQGRLEARTEFLVLHDADIFLQPGTIQGLLEKLRRENLDFISLMANLQMKFAAEKLLIPAFIYFFKLLYPFALGNSPKSKVAVAAGGCVFLRRASLEKIGGFSALKGALIDDCSLAKKIKGAGGKTWMGLTHSVTSHRSYSSLKSIWNMVARSAFTQLRYSTTLLFACTVMMLSLFCFPLMGVVSSTSLPTKFICLTGLVAMFATYIPTLRYYRLNALWAALMPLMGVFYLAMTWTSALRFWFGTGAEWKGRHYSEEQTKSAA